jgi:hypothetical protein
MTTQQIELYEPSIKVDMNWLGQWISLIQTGGLRVDKEIAIRTLYEAKYFLEMQIAELERDLESIEKTIQLLKDN